MTIQDDARVEYGTEYAARQLARRANPLRRAIKRLYVSNVISKIDGPTVDVGCGAGQILERLPKGSAGIEVNPVLVRELQGRGLDVRPAVANPACIDLTGIKPGEFRSLVLSHVLEHFEAAHLVLARLLEDAARLGLQRVLLIVPGPVGYRSDSTHRSFISRNFFQEHGLNHHAGFSLKHLSYFPGNVEWIGSFFVFHELVVLYERQPSADKAESRGSNVPPQNR